MNLIKDLPNIKLNNQILYSDKFFDDVINHLISQGAKKLLKES